ncbi:M3 family metallopeptidase [Arcobacter sp. FWKO B]|uniref:M3 family metallopeptidase n=1 Tax=Arcobacter sp. FWKO B TaxID=2593672 RepID=UPI0018A4CE5A|nr:M3 family metallopeptidase [Arcobacter sp. FWKO B]QOG11374.1 M3 family metallopeptidase [Arcobacter sp. FWKO B]
MFKEFNVSNIESSDLELEKILTQNKEELVLLLQIKNKTYENFVIPYQLMAQRVEEFITPIFHLDSVKNSEITQEVYSKCLPLLSEYDSEISQNVNLYNALKDIQLNYNSTLNDIQNKVLENEIKELERNGCKLNRGDKDILKDINLKLSQLSKEYSQNILNDTNKYEMIIDEFEDVKEIPQSDLELATFKEEGKNKYKFTLHMPSYIAYMTYGTNRQKREELYRAYSTRAPQNGKIIEEILFLKDKKAKILGFENYAQLSLDSKMAKSEDEVIDFLINLAKKAKEKAKQELSEVEELAYELDKLNDIQSYDIAYYSEKLRKKQYSIDEEHYRPYFEQKSVLNGIFEFLNKIFDISFKKINTPVWDEKVEAFDIYENTSIIARIYFDLEARKNKSGGAWMNNWHNKYATDNTKSLPTAFIVCNFPQSSEKIPSLLRHSDVVTLFHELGHGLHHLLTKVDEPFVSGINGVMWDCVEFPSQFLEYFSYEKEVLQMFAKHYQTNEVLGDDDIQKLKNARNFQSSMSMLRQIEFALFDFKLYQMAISKEEGVQKLLDEVRDEIAVILPPKYNKFQNSFSHIFSGGYSAGYYSYKWAEVLSADAFYLFIEKGVFNKTLGTKYKDIILGRGGSADMNDLYFEFANRKPKVDSLLKIDGIIS